LLKLTYKIVLITYEEKEKKMKVLLHPKVVNALNSCLYKPPLANQTAQKMMTLTELDGPPGAATSSRAVFVTTVHLVPQLAIYNADLAINLFISAKQLRPARC
jgi:hypothetical protein